MDVFSCTVAAVSLGRNCLSTLKALHSLHERYRNARTTIAALHSEITVIAASMQYVNVIFEQHPDLAEKRFYENLELEQTFLAALAGCNLILSCLDERVEKVLANLGPETSKGRKGKVQLLWSEESMKELLCTLRGQHSAVFSIIQCFQVQNIADLSAKIEQLRVTVSGNHQSIEETVKESPTVARLSLESSRVSKTVFRDAPRREFSLPLDNQLRSYSSSQDKVELAYRHYQDSISSISTPHSRRSGVKGRSLACGDEESTDDGASTRGLAPSTIVATNTSNDEDFVSDRRSVISSVSTSSWTQKWLETQLSPQETVKALKRVRSTLSVVNTSLFDGRNSIAAFDVQTFVDNINHFMPADADLNDRGTGMEYCAQTAVAGYPESDFLQMLLLQPASTPNFSGSGEESREVILAIDDCIDRQHTESVSSQQIGSYDSSVSISHQSDIGTLSTGFTCSSHEQSPYSSITSETDDLSSSSVEQKQYNNEVSHLDASMTNPAPITTSPSALRLSIYTEKHPHHRGTVICAPAATYASRTGQSFSQALAESIHTSVERTYLPGATVFFVQRENEGSEAPKDS